MAEFNPYRATDPASEAARKTAAWTQQMYRDDRTLRRRASRHINTLNEDFFDFAVNKAAQWYPEESDEYVLEQAEKIEGRLKEEHARANDATRMTLLDMIKEGAAETPEDVLQTEQQRAAIKARKPYTRTEGQVRGVLLQEADDDDKIQILAGEIPEKYRARAEELQTEELMGQESKQSGVLGKLGHALGIGGLGAEGALAGGTQALREEYGVEPTAERPGAFGEGMEWLVRGAAGIAGGPAGMLGGLIGRQLAKPNIAGVKTQEILKRPTGLLPVLSRAAEYAGRSMAGGLGAVDWSDELNQIAQDYNQFAIEEAVRRHPTLTDEEVAAEAEKLYDAYIANDAMGFAAEHPDYAQFVAEFALDPITYLGASIVTGPAKTLMRGLQAGTKAAAAKSPAVAKALAKGAEVGAKAGTAVAESKPVELAKIAKDNLTHLPMLRRLGKKGGDVAETAASKARMGEAISMQATREKGQKLQELVNKLRKATKGFTEQEQAMLFDLIDRPDKLPPGILIPDKMRLPRTIAKEIADQGWDLRKQTNVMERWATGKGPADVLEEITARQHYVPHVLFDVPPDKIATVGAKPKMKPGRYIATSDRARTGANRNVVKNVADQFEAYVEKMVPKQQPAWQLKLSDKAMREGDLVVDVERVPGTFQGEGKLAKLWEEIEIRGGMGQVRDYYTDQIANSERILSENLARRNMYKPSDPAWAVWNDEALKSHKVIAEQKELLGVVEGKQQIAAKIAEMEKRTGLEYAMLEDELYKPYREIVGSDPLGGGAKISKLNSHITLVPKEYGDLVKSLVPAARSEDDFYKVTNGAMKGLIRPYMKAWRQGKTIWGGLAFSARNFAGGFGLSTLGLGWRAFDPELQIKSMMASFAAASGNPKALKAVGKLGWTMRNGKTVPLTEVLEAANKLGITSQLEFHLGQEMMSKGLLSKGVDMMSMASEFGNVKGIRHLSPAYAARATENYQHLVTFMGALEDMSERGLAKALDFTSKWSGNYARLGKWEQGLLRDTVGFYSWLRFIMPHVATQVFENPQRLGAWVKALGGVERYTGREAPFSASGTPHHLKAFGVTALPAAQPDQHIRNVGSHQYAMMMIENPLTMGLSILPALGSVFGPEVRGPRMLELMGPATQLLVDMVTGSDPRTGEKIPEFFSFDSIKHFATSGAAKAIQDIPERPLGIMRDYWQLYFDDGRPAEAYDLALRYRAGRHFLGLDNWVARAVGAEPRSIGGMMDPATGGMLGASVYPVDPLRQAYGRKRDLVGGQGWQEYSRKQALQRVGF